MNIPKDWIEKHARAEAGECTTIGAMPTASLYEYLHAQLTRSDPHPAIDHAIRATLHKDGRITFYIHAAGRNSDTSDFCLMPNVN